MSEPSSSSVSSPTSHAGAAGAAKFGANGGRRTAPPTGLKTTAAAAGGAADTPAALPTAPPVCPLLSPAVRVAEEATRALPVGPPLTKLSPESSTSPNSIMAELVAAVERLWAPTAALAEARLPAITPAAAALPCRPPACSAAAPAAAALVAPLAAAHKTCPGLSLLLPTPPVEPAAVRLVRLSACLPAPDTAAITGALCLGKPAGGAPGTAGVGAAWPGAAAC